MGASNASSPGSVTEATVRWHQENWSLVAAGTFQLILWIVTVALAARFVEGRDHDARLPLWLVALWGIAFGLYLWSVTAVQRRAAAGDAGRASLRRILFFAILFRVVLWWSPPMLETDYYRYLWDGRVLLEGVNPCRYSPAEIELSSAEMEADGRGWLVRLLNCEPEVKQIFDRIEHREVPSLYPPLSQAVFGIAAWLTPEQWPVTAHVRALKAVLLVFDFATILLVVALLRELGLPPSLVVAYAWCPLVLKEFANSGHHDSIAVCLTMAALWLLLRAARAQEARTPCWGWHAGAAVVWAAAVLAKLYPLVLAPLLLVWWWRKVRWGVAWLTALSCGTVLVGYAIMPGGLSEVGSGNTMQGLGEFFRRWEMNDLLFSVVYENLKPPWADGRPSPWYAVSPVAMRECVVSLASLHAINAPFRFAQLGMAAMFSAFVLRVSLARWPTEDRLALLRRAFFCLAWLWFLSATQNPWYWTWGLPLVVLVRGPWLFASGFALLYYLRFWFAGLSLPPPGGSGAASGVRWFDEVVVWLEHGPVLAMLVWHEWRQRRQPEPDGVRLTG